MELGATGRRSAIKACDERERERLGLTVANAERAPARASHEPPGLRRPGPSGFSDAEAVPSRDSGRGRWHRQNHFFINRGGSELHTPT
ncbi:hypothetical protein MHYP_G00000730 [Metynnis hypsauchen]